MSTDTNHVELALPEEWLAESWNKQADDLNQWDSLSLGEQLGWAQVQAVEADRARAALDAEPVGDGPSLNSALARWGRPIAPPATEPNDWFTVAAVAQDMRSRGQAEQMAGEELLKLANSNRFQPARSAIPPAPEVGSQDRLRIMYAGIRYGYIAGHNDTVEACYGDPDDVAAFYAPEILGELDAAIPLPAPQAGEVQP